MLFNLGALSLLAGSALAHLQLSDPLPIKSPLNSAVPNDDKDYSYTAPLISNGLPYPCKGYLDSSASLRTPQKSWSAGSTQSFTIAPNGAIHGGGSCQLSLSYDMGQTWNVIYSYIGGCMAEDLTNSFTIPKAAPSGEAVFSWTWFNRLGNREMYQNCAIVTVTNGGSGLNSRDHPAPFVANAGSVNSCSTIENQDVVFPKPGATVKYSGEYRGTTPASNRGVTGNGCSHPGGADGAGTKRGNGGGGGGESPASSSASASTSTSVAVSKSSAQAAATPIKENPVLLPISVPSSSSSVSTPSSSTIPAAAAATTTKARTCRRRKSVIPRDLVQSHRERKVRRHVGWGMRRMDPEARSGRVAAMKAEKPVYKD